MGLNASVYRNANRLKAEYGVDAFDIDAETGEAMPKPGMHFDGVKPSFIAAKRRLGNFDTIGTLRQKISKILNEDESILLRKILYNPTHCGDLIKPANFAKIKCEVEIIKAATSDPSVITFVEAIAELVDVALAEDNPIVFI